MRTQLKPCKCGRTPAIVELNVSELPVYHAYCKCGQATTWRLTKEAVEHDWNTQHGVDKPKCARHMSVLEHRKAVMGYA